MINLNKQLAWTTVQIAQILVLFWCAIVGSDARASTLKVTVVDHDKQPIADVAVFVKTVGVASSNLISDETKATVDQIDKRFVPSLLVIQTGTLVEFPNSDTVAHHVYSFSHPNEFKLPLYKGHAHPPVTFLESGIVSLGCNVHDNMLGYIFVVDTPYFAKTDSNGVATIDVDDTTLSSVSVWSPRFRDSPASFEMPLNDDSSGDQQVEFQIDKPLRPPLDQLSNVLSWSDY